MSQVDHGHAAAAEFRQDLVLAERCLSQSVEDLVLRQGAGGIDVLSCGIGGTDGTCHPALGAELRVRRHAVAAASTLAHRRRCPSWSSECFM